MHRQPANTYNGTNAATCTDGHGGAVPNRNGDGRADQHAGANGDRNSLSYSDSYHDSVGHGHRDTNADTNTNGHGYDHSDTVDNTNSHTHSDSDTSSDADAYSRSNINTSPDANAYARTVSDTYTKSHAIANRNTSPDGNTYTVADTNGDSHTAAKHRRATHGPRGLLRRDQWRPMEEQRGLALRPDTGPMARSLCRLTRQRHRTPARPKQPLWHNPS